MSDATATIAEYFATRTEAARAEADRANVALAEAEAAQLAFAEHGTLPPTTGAMKQGWELADWVTNRATLIGYDVTKGKATAEDYYRAKEERANVLAWMESHGYEVPRPYKS